MSDRTAAPGPSGWRAWAPLTAILAGGIATFSPAIGAFRFADDNLQVAMVRGTFPAPRGPLDLYDFIDEGSREPLRDIGFLPWWAHPQIQIRFFRPLPSLLRYAEERWIEGAPLVYHLHSLAWWAACVVAAFALYRRLFDRRVALLATLVFALAPAHSVPLTWLANREALLSIAFGLVGLAAYRAWRLTWSARAGLAALGLFALSFLAGEYALCLGGYVAAFELFAGSAGAPGVRGVPKRALGLVPFVLPAAAYLGVRAHLHYGSFGSGFYSDPLRDPVAFFHTAPWRTMSLLGDGWLGIETGSWMPDPVRPYYYAFLALVAPVVVLVVVRGLRGVDGAARTDARWLLLGSFLSIIPVLAVLPSTRLLGMSMIGLSATIALAVGRVWWPPAAPESRPRLAAFASVVVLVLSFVHLVVAPVHGFVGARYVRQWGNDFDSWARLVAAYTVRDTPRDVVEVRGPGRTFFLPFAETTGFARPHRWNVLSCTGHVLVLRPDPTTLEVYAAEGASLFAEADGNLFRAEASHLHVGDQMDAAGMHVTVLGVGAMGPTAARYTFERPLEDPRFMWLNDRSTGLQEIELPLVGMGLPLDP